MLTFLLGLVNPLKAIAREIAQIQVARKNAETDQARIEADIRMTQLQARQRALTEGRGAWVSKAVQAAYAAPFVIYNGKVIIWDKVLGWGVTDPLGPFEQQVGTIIVGFYFLAIGGRAIINQWRA